MSFIAENWSEILDVVLGVAAASGLGWAVLIKKAKDELVEVIDKSSPDNIEFKAIARTAGKKAAAKALAKLAG